MAGRAGNISTSIDNLHEINGLFLVHYTGIHFKKDSLSNTGCKPCVKCEQDRNFGFLTSASYSHRQTWQLTKSLIGSTSCRPLTPPFHYVSTIDNVKKKLNWLKPCWNVISSSIEGATSCLQLHFKIFSCLVSSAFQNRGRFDLTQRNTATQFSIRVSNNRTFTFNAIN